MPAAHSMQIGQISSGREIMVTEWHDINTPSFSFTQKPQEPKQKKPHRGIGDALDGPIPDPPPVEYRIKYVRPVEPESGFRHNKAYDIEGEIEELVEKVTQPRIMLYPKGIYKKSVDNFFPNGIEVFPDKDGKFRVMCNHLFNAMEYDKDHEKHDEATWTLIIRAQGRTAEKIVESEPLTFPQPQKPFLDLRMGHYDDFGASSYHKPREGGDYVRGEAVKILQQDLISLRFLQEGEDDGFFSSKTDVAVKKFKEIANDKYRMPCKLGKLIEVQSTLEQSCPDGVVGSNTRDEIDLWKKMGWVKPAIILRHGDYDDDGVKNHKGQHGGDDHHIMTPIKELQRGLKERGFESVGAEDGWFRDKTKEAIIEFQTCAAESTRLVMGEIKEVDITFKGNPNGIFDEPTREELYSVWKAHDHKPAGISDSAMIFAAPGMNNGEGGWFVCEEKQIDSLINEVTELIDLQEEILQFRESCRAAEISEVTTQKAKELEEKVAEKFKGITKNPAEAIQELLLVKSNPRWPSAMSKRVYIRPYQTKNGTVGGHWRKNNHGSIEKALKKWLRQENQKGNADGGMDLMLKAMIWESDKLDEKWPWEFKTLKGKKGQDTAAGYFEGSAEAQFFRFVAGANAGTEFNFKDMEIKLTASGNAIYTLAEGTVSGLWSLPGENGFDIFDHLVLSTNARNALKNGHECRFRLTTKAQAKAFAGAAITAAVGLPCIDLSRNDKLESGRNNKAAAGASASGFAGASLEGKIAAIIQWRDQLNLQFDDLAQVGAFGGGGAGIGGEAKFEIKYDNGKIRFEAGALAVLGVGGKGGAAFELGVEEGIELMAHLFNCVNFHRMDSVAWAAFEVYMNVTFMQFVVAGKVALKIGDTISSWLSRRKEVDPFLKQTKQAIYVNINDKKKLQNSPPEALGELLQTLTEAPKEEDFNAILKVLQSAEGRNDDAHKLKWIIRSFHDAELSRRGNVTDAMKKAALEEGIRELMGFGGDIDEIQRNQYVNQIQVTLQRNGIRHGP